MSNHSRWFALVLVVALAAVVGVFAYNLGLAHGIARTAPRVAAPAGPTGVVPFAYYPRPWGWGFGFFPFFGLIWIFLFFALLRPLWWGWGPRWYGRGCRRYRDEGRVPPEFEEWHRRVHGQNAPEPTRP